MKKINDTIIKERVSTTLSTHDFYYDLPEELIAQFPSKKRDMCRLMVLDRNDKSVEHKIFRDIIDYLNPEDMLVVNSSKVIPARLLGTTEKTGASMELLLLRALDCGEWETLVRPGKRAKVGAAFNFSDILKATVTKVLDDGNRVVRFEYIRVINICFILSKAVKKVAVKRNLYYLSEKEVELSKKL